jgi:hypothetical protein
MSAVREAILDLWSAGESAPEIVAALNLTAGEPEAYVRTTVQRARARKDPRAVLRGSGQRGEFASVRIARASNAYKKIAGAAAARHLTPETLMTMLLVNIGEHDLFKAVLDD